ncbi:hypothetical protein AGMMS50267_14540 [Spirochaetia bacterium]|nr:hypothetical protein AGMMS50267_14540 [Spirochaetia bacterium]
MGCPCWIARHLPGRRPGAVCGKNCCGWRGGGALALTLALALSILGCRQPSSGSPSGGDTPVALTGVSADGGSTTATTTKLTLTFDQDITGLAAGDIALSDDDSTGATKGDLTRAGAGVYELGLGGIIDSGTVTVSVTKTGYTISGSPKTVAVYHYVDPSATPVVFTGLDADGGSTTATTTKLTLTFDQDITGLAAGDIFLSDSGSATGAFKGSLTKLAGTGGYELGLGGVTASGTVTVSILWGAFPRWCRRAFLPGTGGWWIPYRKRWPKPDGFVLR